MDITNKFEPSSGQGGWAYFLYMVIVVTIPPERATMGPISSM